MASGLKLNGRPSPGALRGMNKILQVLDRFLLGGNRLTNHVVNRNDSRVAPLIEHRQVADVLVAHELHAVFEGVFGGYTGQVGGHDVADAGVA